MASNNDWKKIDFSLDLVSLADKHIQFLAYIDSEKIFYHGDILEQAIYRYEKYWLPFCANMMESGEDMKKYYPPFDVAWVWHCHLLCPTDYIEDCKTICGRVVDHSSYSISEIISKQRYTEAIWVENFKIAFDYLAENSVGDRREFKQFRSRLKYDLASASHRQKGFYYQVSLPHFRLDAFLQQCLDRYKKFLLLKLLHPNEFAVPCYAIDIIWHTHQLSPLTYAKETHKLLGFVFPHDDTTSDRSPGSKLSNAGAQTKELWKSIFKEDFFFPGAMYRGEKPSSPYFVHNDDFDYSMFYSKAGRFVLEENRLVCKTDSNSSKAIFKMQVTQNKMIIYNGELSVGNVLKFSNSFPYNQLDEKSLAIRVLIAYKENFSEKFMNKLKLGSAHALNHSVFDPKLAIPQSGSEHQSFKLTFNDSKGNPYVLDQKWKIDCQAQNSIGLSLVQQPFQSIHMANILYQYDGFDLKNRNLQGTNGDGIRAQHLVTAMLNGEQVNVFKAEIIHVVALQWSSIKIMLGEKLLATAHLTGWTQLPSNLQLSDKDSSCITFDPKTERAMLVRHLDGDYAIVKGKWVGMKRGIPPKKKGMRGVPGDPGRLQVTLYFFDKKSSEIIEIKPDTLFRFTSRTTETTVDLKTGKVYFQLLKDHVNNLEIESNLAIVFGVAVLHVLLQPKPAPYVDAVKNGKPTKKPTINPYFIPSQSSTAVYRGSRPVRSVNMNSYILFSSIGYYDLISTPCFYEHYCGYHHHHHHHHDNNNGNDNCNNSNNGDNGNNNDCGDYGNNNNNDNGNGNGNDNCNPWFDGNSGNGGGNDGGGNDGNSGGGCGGSGDSGGNGTFGGCGGCGGGGGGGTSSCGGGATSSCGGGTSSCGGNGGTSSCGGSGGGTSSCGGSGGGTSSCGGGGTTSSCGGGTSSCGSSGGGSSCGGGGSSCGGGGSSCGGSS